MLLFASLTWLRIPCHQVQSTHFADFWAPELGKAGYTAIFKKKTAEVCLLPLHASLSPLHASDTPVAHLACI
jgi:mRNA deadenylase 3'-5' endonuclease subunit Ccr4